MDNDYIYLIQKIHQTLKEKWSELKDIKILINKDGVFASYIDGWEPHPRSNQHMRTHYAIHDVDMDADIAIRALYNSNFVNSNEISINSSIMNTPSYQARVLLSNVEHLLTQDCVKPENITYLDMKVFEENTFTSNMKLFNKKASFRRCAYILGEEKLHLSSDFLLETNCPHIIDPVDNILIPGTKKLILWESFGPIEKTDIHKLIDINNMCDALNKKLINDIEQMEEKTFQDMQNLTSSNIHNKQITPTIERT